MFANSLTTQTTGPQDTANVAMRLGQMLSSGDVILLSGDIGTGKTHFARHLIQSLQDAPEDVPSPSFTLVQTYQTRSGEVWHADLYRISTPGEIEELGLSDAFETAICLIEWPDRMGDAVPLDALFLHFDLGEAETDRTLTFKWANDRWAKSLKIALA
ncbi:MAG: tRNA (adenosine(37)-N6)-threonylcarbamoyltransferase complex ATPase subunit type 1 TsaE [Paracoccaceae bacterium]